MAASYKELVAEVADLEARKGTLNRDERARLPWARRELASTPEQMAISRAQAAERDRVIVGMIREYDQRLAGLRL